MDHSEEIHRTNLCCMPTELIEAVMLQLSVQGLEAMQLLSTRIYQIARPMIWGSLRLVPAWYSECGLTPWSLEDVNFKQVTGRYIFDLKRAVKKGQVEPRWIKTLEISSPKYQNTYRTTSLKWAKPLKFAKTLVQEWALEYFVHDVLAGRLTNLETLNIFTGRGSQKHLVATHGMQWNSSGRPVPAALINCQNVKNITLNFLQPQKAVDRYTFATLGPNVESFRIKQFSRIRASSLKTAFEKCKKLKMIHIECGYIEEDGYTNWLPESVETLEILPRSKQDHRVLPKLVAPNVTRLATTLGNYRVTDMQYWTPNATHLDVKNTTSCSCFHIAGFTELCKDYYPNVKHLRLDSIREGYRTVLALFPCIKSLSLLAVGGRPQVLGDYVGENFIADVVSSAVTVYNKELEDLYVALPEADPTMRAIVKNVKDNGGDLPRNTYFGCYDQNSDCERCFDHSIYNGFPQCLMHRPHAAHGCKLLDEHELFDAFDWIEPPYIFRYIHAPA